MSIQPSWSNRLPPQVRGSRSCFGLGARGRSLGGALTLTCITFATPAAAQDLPDIGKLADFIRWSGVAVSSFVILGGVVLVRGMATIAARLSKSFPSRRPVIQKVESALRFLIYISAAGVVTGLSVRLDPTALAVIGGALAFAFGFAMRDLVAAFIAGITIMFDRPFQVGDRVTFAGERGDVTKIGLRSVQMFTLDHNVVTIPNNKVLTDVTVSNNYGELEMQVPMDFFIGIDQDARLALEIVREACLTSPYVLSRRPVPVYVTQMQFAHCLALSLKARPYVFDSRYDQEFCTDVNLRVLEAFREHRIGPPQILPGNIAAQLDPSIGVHEDEPPS